MGYTGVTWINARSRQGVEHVWGVPHHIPRPESGMISLQNDGLNVEEVNEENKKHGRLWY